MSSSAFTILTEVLKARFASILLLLSLFLSGCGGGSAGTGTGNELRTIEGVIVSEDGAPLAGASVTLAETGDHTTTAADGSFSLSTDFVGETLNITVASDAGSTTVAVTTAPDESSTVRVDISINSQHQVSGIQSLQVKAQVVGACDANFENRRVIRQSTRIPNGTSCTVRVEIYGDGKLLERIPFVVQRSGCSGSKWTTESTAATGFGIHAGVGQAPFEYFDDEPHCIYRVVAPFQVQGLKSVIYEIDTFRKQRFDTSGK